MTSPQNETWVEGHVVAGEVLQQLVANLIEEDHLADLAQNFREGPGFYTLNTKAPKVQKILMGLDYKYYENLPHDFPEKIGYAAEQVMSEMDESDIAATKEVIKAYLRGMNTKNVQQQRHMQPVFWWPNTDTLYQEVAKILIESHFKGQNEKPEVEKGITAALSAVPDLDKTVHSYPDGLVQLEDSENALEDVRGIAREIVDSMTTTQKAHFQAIINGHL